MQGKDFYGSGPLAPKTPGSREAKLFCGAFFQKSGFFLRAAAQRHVKNFSSFFRKTRLVARQQRFRLGSGSQKIIFRLNTE
jgi:hypothetical protein